MSKEPKVRAKTKAELEAEDKAKAENIIAAERAKETNGFIERYIFSSKDIIHKAKLDGTPDLDGAMYNLLEELDNGYTVYPQAADPSQPSPTYFLHRKYFLPDSGLL